MKTLTTEMQAGIFAAAVAVAATLRRVAPGAARELAGLGYIISTVAPPYDELVEWQRANGFPIFDRQGYEEAVRGASTSAALAFNGTETQN